MLLGIIEGVSSLIKVESFLIIDKVSPEPHLSSATNKTVFSMLCSLLGKKTESSNSCGGFSLNAVESMHFCCTSSFESMLGSPILNGSNGPAMLKMFHKSCILIKNLLALFCPKASV